MLNKKFFGNYRALVVDNRDPEYFGRVRVWIPDLMPDVPREKGIWARPANNPIGGRNLENPDENFYTGSCYIPKKGSWVFVFFEGGNPNRPYYFGALDIENTTVLPENRLGTNYPDKWTIFKSHQGRAIIISDDKDDERVEITGKKRKLKEPPSGDTGSVYDIDGNQTVILLDERQGKEKILIRTYKGDFIHVDVGSRELEIHFQGDILIRSEKEVNVTANQDINLKSLNGNVNIQADNGSVNVKGAQNVNHESGGNLNLKSGGDFNYTAAGSINGRGSGNMYIDVSLSPGQSGVSTPASGAGNSDEANPEGNRDT